MKSIQEVSEQTLLIQKYLIDYPKDQLLTYKDLEIATGVKMDFRGKQFMRSAFRRMSMPYETIKGVGVRMTNKENAISQIAHSVEKIDKAVIRSEKVTKNVRSLVYNELSDNEKRHIDFVGAVFGTIRSYSNSAKMIFKKDNVLVGQTVK